MHIELPNYEPTSHFSLLTYHSSPILYSPTTHIELPNYEPSTLQLRTTNLSLITYYFSLLPSISLSE
jgi:hypothetical protein